jgi:hypothetical protein
MYACWFAPGGPANKENQVKMYKKVLFQVHYLFEIVGSMYQDPYQIVWSGSGSKW